MMTKLNKKQTHKFLRMVEDGLKHPVGPIPTPRLEQATKQIMKDAEVQASIKKLLEWTPEGVDLEEISKINYPPNVWGKDRMFTNGDDKCPFFSEAYLYNLLGKQDGRTLLALMRQLCESLGIETDL